MLLFYIRHGHPTYDPDCLTEEGFKEAEALVCRMKRINPDKIYSSTLTRAYQTAEPTAKALNKEITKLDWCNEHYAWLDFSVKDESSGNNHWVFHLDKYKKIFGTKEIRDLGENWYNHPGLKEFNFKKGIDRIKTETYSFLEDLGYKHTENGYKVIKPNNDRIALFAHQGFGLSFLSAVLDIPFPVVTTHFDMTYTGITVISFEGDDIITPKVLQLSNDSHLFASGMETIYNNGHKF